MTELNTMRYCVLKKQLYHNFVAYTDRYLSMVCCSGKFKRVSGLGVGLKCGQTEINKKAASPLYFLLQTVSTLVCDMNKWMDRIYVKYMKILSLIMIYWSRLRLEVSISTSASMLFYTSFRSSSHFVSITWF